MKSRVLRWLLEQTNVRVLGVITARGGSKGVPRKNIRIVNGKPLLAYTAEAALGSQALTDVVLSTDDPEIAAIGESFGLTVPFIRPGHLALDTTPTLPVLQHALSEMEARTMPYDAICLLQPTSPLRRVGDIDRCIELLSQSGADSVVSVTPVPHECNPHWVYFAEADGSLHIATGEPTPIARRQDLPAAYHRDGSIYVTRRNVLISGSLYGRRVQGFVIEATNHVNIDTEYDLVTAEKKLAAASA